MFELYQEEYNDALTSLTMFDLIPVIALVQVSHKSKMAQLWLCELSRQLWVLDFMISFTLKGVASITPPNGLKQ